MTRQEATYLAGFSVVGLGALIATAWQFFLATETPASHLGRVIRLRG